MCFATHEAVFSGDTVLGRGTAVVAWPDGDLGAYLNSLEVLAAYPRIHRDKQGYWDVPMSAGVRLRIAMPRTTVQEIGLSLTDQDCFGYAFANANDCGRYGLYPGCGI